MNTDRITYSNNDDGLSNNTARLSWVIPMKLLDLDTIIMTTCYPMIVLGLHIPIMKIGYLLLFKFC